MAPLIHTIASIVLRKPEIKDMEALYLYKNDGSIMELLVGVSTGYSYNDIQKWIEYHQKKRDEVIWVIAKKEDDSCLGHVGFYNIDHRIGSAEFAILLGDKIRWGKGMGREISQATVTYGFNILNLNRIYLNVLKNNKRALKLYNAIGFKEEGLLRQAQYKNGMYLDIVVMSLLREEFNAESS